MVNIDDTAHLVEGHSGPRFPPELERHIFELSAWNSRKHIPQLVLVAYRVWTWVEPILCEIVVFQGERTRFPSNRQAQYVKHLLVAARMDRFNMINFIRRCPNLRNLGYWHLLAQESLLSYFSSVTYATNPNNVGTLVARPPYRNAHAPLLRLSIYLDDLFRGEENTDFNHPIFRHLTHLEVWGGINLLTWEEGNSFACLRELKYLALTGGASPVLITKILEECEKLELLVLWLFYGASPVLDGLPTTITRKTTGVMEGIEDRMVIMPPVAGGKWAVQDWVSGAEGKPDFWERGMKILEKRKQESRRKIRKKRKELLETSNLLEYDEDFELGPWLSS
ncbi:hypothetical protein AX16_007394 [Volvariella volvacea WC 439]|nr:hypothetical protein AX16_007394 [Volvariella volvacea WC 439]